MKNTLLRKSLWLVVFALVVAGGAQQVRSQPLMELLGSPSATNPMTARAWGSGPAAAYFNPALLVHEEGSTAVLSFLYLGQFLDIGLAPRASSLDISSEIYDARIRLPDGGNARLDYRPLPTDALRNARGSADPGTSGYYLEFGGTLVVVPKRLVFGIHALLPAGSAMQQASSFPDEREQSFSNSLSFELLGDRMSGTAFSVGLGGRVLSWLDLGVGLSMTTASRAISDVYIQDATYQETAYIQTRFKVDLSVVPHFAVSIRPLQNLSVSATLHLPAESSIEGGTDVQMWNYPYAEGESSLTQRFEFAGGFEPLRGGLGVAYLSPQEGGFGWGVAGAAKYARWSDYRNRHNEAPEDDWSDTLSASAGGQIALGPHVVSLDLAYVPTPVPAQTGRSNYVDNSRAGASLSWHLALPLAGRTWTVGLQAQLHRLFSRSVEKSLDASHPVFDEFPDSVYVTSGGEIESSAGLQTNNPGYPGFSSEGWLFGAALTLGVTL